MAAATEVKTINLPVLSINRTVSILSDIYVKVIRQNLSPKIIPSVMLWGPPGVGKSQAVRQIAEEIGRETGKKTHVTDVRLLLFNPIDLRGIPAADAERTTPKKAAETAPTVFFIAMFSLLKPF